MPTTGDDTQHGYYRLRLGLDLGTGHMSIDGQHVQGDHYSDPQPLILKGWRGTSIRQIAILEADGNVIYGIEDVVEAVRKHSKYYDQEIERFKLALHSEFEHLDEVKHGKEILCAEKDRGAIQDFFTDLFRTLLEDVRTCYKNVAHNAGRDDDYWNKIPLELQISVPSMWDDDARGIIRNAAKTAGAWRAELREEPLCVATTYMVDMVKSGSIKAEQRVLLIDYGQGTLDIAIVELVCEPSAGKLMQLRRIGLCSGSDAGAHKVNTAAEEWLLSSGCREIQSRGGFEATCGKLHLTRRQFLRAFSD
jgi:hypothetical protein